jgi:hypothetical protein
MGDRSDAQHQGAEDDRRDHHLDQRDEARAQRLELDGEVGGHQAHRDACEHRGDHREVQIVRAVLAGRSRRIR